MTVNQDWTADLTRRLVELFHTNISFSHIASELGVTRNSALAKCNRLGLKRSLPARKPFQHVIRHIRKETGHRRSRAKVITDGPITNLASLPPTDPADLATPLEQRKTMETLAPRDCRFVIGDVQTSWFFCGAPRHHNFPYCERHSLRCYGT